MFVNEVSQQAASERYIKCTIFKYFGQNPVDELHGRKLKLHNLPQQTGTA